MSVKHELILDNQMLTVSHHPRDGFWIYDKTRGMNLAMRAKTEQEAWLEVVGYYQNRLRDVEGQLKSITAKVDAFVAQFVEEEDQD
ncbi:hypothetical protein Lumi_094 [Xylophilus phage Lumi]|nr:hypothetical protein Lumi_094 [Xylophilus phage Lumi]